MKSTKLNSKQTNNYFLAILSGVALALAFPPMPFFLLALIAFIPIFIILNNEEETKKFRYIYLTFFIYHLGTNYWISSWQETTDPYLFWSGIILDFVHPFFFFVPFIIYNLLRKIIDKQTLLYFFPLIWVTFEWLHSLGDLGYPWLTVAFTQFNNYYWFQVVDITGIWGASLLILYINVFFYKISEEIMKTDKKTLNSTILKNIAIIILMLLLPTTYGFFITKKFDYEKEIKENKKIKIGLIQPNIDPWDKWEKNNLEQIKLHFILQDSISKKHPDINLFIWNETAIPAISISINRDLQFDFIQYQLKKNNAALLTGFAQYEFLNKTDENLPATARPFPFDTSQLFCSYNSAILLTPNTNDTLQVYHKQRLTPFAEGIPFVEYLGFAQKFLTWDVGISTWEKGKEIKNFNLNIENQNIAIAPIICIESIFPDFVRKFVQQGAEIITIITNDAWYNYTFGPKQHYMLAATRAIENRRYIARCANSGVTGFISPTGKTIECAEPYQTTAITKTIPALKEKTLYTTYGDFLPKTCALIILITAIIMLFLRKKQVKI